MSRLPLTYEEKFQAMQALLLFPGDASLHMRKPGDWYVILKRVDIRSNNVLISAGASGATPAEAVEATWESLTKLPQNSTLAISGEVGSRTVVWNGFMWRDVEGGGNV